MEKINKGVKCRIDIDWKMYAGCSGWFDKKGIFEIVKYTTTVTMSTNNTPIWTLVGVVDDDLIITADGINMSKTPKKYVRILNPLIKNI